MKNAANIPSFQAASLLAEASAYVYTLFREKLPSTVVFHTYQHTRDVVAAAETIGRASGLDEGAITLILLAAWFHDTGFTEVYEDHEGASARLAVEFLEARGVPDVQIAEVVRLILATRVGHTPQDLCEAVLRDADLSHIGSECFAERALLLRTEWDHHADVCFSDREWLELQFAFLSTVRFETPYARQHFSAHHQQNLEQIEAELAELMRKQS